MEKNKNGVALTYSDIVIIPGYLKAGTIHDTSAILGKDAEGYPFVLKIPFMSAAMDTVTEANMAIAMARAGGIGVIHTNFSPEEQAEQVRKVKRAENLMISNPICVSNTTSIKDTAEIMRKTGFSSIPVLDENQKILGIAVTPSIRFEEENLKSITTTMSKPMIITLKQVQDKSGSISLSKAKKIFIKNAKNNTKVLLVANEDHTLVGMITSKDVENLKTFPNATKDHQGRLRVAAAISTAPNILERVHLLIKEDVDMLVIDSSHGYSDHVGNTIRNIKKVYPNIPIVAGNVVEAKGTQFLAEAGADIIKVGIGPGAICTTRKISGVGLSQFTAILDVHQALIDNNFKIPIIADGGIKYTGDLGKAIVAGADAIMMGSVFAGTEEAPGTTMIHQGAKVKIYRGMGSLAAMKEGSGSRYEQKTAELISHGVVAYVPFKGNVNDIITQYAGGLRETMKLTGSSTLKELQKAEWRQITNAGELESRPHDVTLAYEEPNYKL